ncbi:hypothetical protein PV326_002734 [Microctonus aethiopoides]|nr:hypothetical protein PV326_002734 [Microctonus aethiopoides]
MISKRFSSVVTVFGRPDFGSKYRRTLLDRTRIEEDFHKNCNLECTEESNTCHEEKNIDQDEFSLQQQADHKSEAACFNDENKKFTSGSLAQKTDKSCR